MKASVLLLPLALSSVACGAVFPEIAPPVKAPPAGRALEPAPPSDLLYVVVARAEIPERTRDGRQWDSMGGAAPDPFAKILVNDKEILQTPVQSDTLKPTWRDQKRANYKISPEARIRVEVWDANTLNNHPICLKNLRNLPEQAGPNPVEIVCDSGAHVTLTVEPAHPRWGLGFSYELRTIGIGITRVMKYSPAKRAGLEPGEEILEIGGKRVAKMEEGEAQSLINANAQTGIELLVRRADKTNERKVTLMEGVIYPVSDEDVPLD
ncbi:MAG TPA: PDZ domain-containing protein [Polyangiaceae bacterium]|nr:PDZ domain-containing protein [Polyangiaceae bacterium]